MAGQQGRRSLFLVLNGLKEGNSLVPGQRLKLIVN
jgi:hypothetical protein